MNYVYKKDEIVIEYVKKICDEFVSFWFFEILVSGLEFFPGGGGHVLCIL